jgi:UPF0271 protein
MTPPLPRIDLNADLGEEAGDDAAMLACVTSASVCCGAHAGGPATLRATLRAAAARGVTCGAHPGYPDRAGFGRTVMPMTAAETEAMVAAQLHDALAAAADTGTAIAYVKPHGALYNLAADDADTATAIARAIRAVNPALVLLGLAGSAMLPAADRAGLRHAAEAFADRGYRPDGRLMPRGTPGAVLHDPAAIAARALRMAQDGTVDTQDGTSIALRPDSLCLHGDTPGAVAMARTVRAALAAAGLALAPFA